MQDTLPHGGGVLRGADGALGGLRTERYARYVTLARLQHEGDGRRIRHALVGDVLEAVPSETVRAAGGLHPRPAAPGQGRPLNGLAAAQVVLAGDADAVARPMKFAVTVGGPQVVIGDGGFLRIDAGVLPLATHAFH